MPKANILVVEDEIIIAKIIENILRMFDFHVAAVVSNGPDAVDSLRRHKIDLVLMDIGLPGEMDGIQAAESIRTIANIPVVYLTAYSDEKTLERAKLTQPYGYIPKPFQENELRSTLEMALFKHKMERQLQESELRFRSIFENSLDPIYLAAPDGYLISANPAFLRLFGYNADEIPALNTRTLYLSEDEKTKYDSILYRYGFLRDYEIRMRRKDGTIILAQETTTLIRDESDEIIAFQGIVRDVTEKKKRDEDLSLLQAAITSSSDALIITNIDGAIQYVNPAFEYITGYGRAEVLGRNPNILKSGQQSREFYRRIWETITTGDSWSGEFINRRKNGSLYNQYTSISPVFDSSGRITHFIGIATDITKEKKLEEQLLQAVKMDSLGRLAGGVAHDFNNLLTIINGYAEMLLLDMAESKHRENVMEILKAGEKAAKLTQHILAFSRKQVVYPQVLNINDVISDFQKMVRRIIGEDIELNIRLTPDPGSTRLDPSQLEQVLMNLVVNARDAMPQGGKLTIETARFVMDDKFVEKNLGARSGEYVHLSIQDTGVGMSREIQERIFEPFFTTKPHGAGTGLGLSTVYGVVKQNNGYITVGSEPGHGARFDVYFPLHLESEAVPLGEARADSYAPPYSGSLVLIVEDEESVRRLAERIFSSLGFTVMTAENGAAGVKAAQEHPGRIDLLFSDLVMPEMSGQESAQRIKELHPEIQVLFTSGYPEQTEKPHFLIERPEQFISKPYSRQSVRRKVDALLGRG